MAGVTYDEDADVLYVRLVEGDIAGQKFLDDTRILDCNVDGGVAGIEFVCASEGIHLRDLPFSRRVECLIGESGRSFKIFAPWVDIGRPPCLPVPARNAFSPYHDDGPLTQGSRGHERVWVILPSWSRAPN